MSSAGSSRTASSKRVREEDPGMYENVLFERALRTLGRADPARWISVERPVETREEKDEDEAP